ncbi:MAG: single-stranded-DNA-specific exonuclease RecJ [Ruminococcaceae bacterium]|nr:single-stranded-DNA-specific exonuclease RecJ [Oscillospiraceae bacterium]
METAVQKSKWRVLFDPENVELNKTVSELSSKLKVTSTTAKLLCLRGYNTVADAERFLHFSDIIPHDPFLMKDMDRAVDRLQTALDRKERIAVFGDYDVDGATATSLLYLYLSQKGADVGYYIPSRSKEGYGLSTAAIDILKGKGVSLIVTVDTGITSIEEIDYAKRKGIDTIVTDHHACRPELPKCCAVVNPHRADDSYPFCELAGVGVAFKLACAMEIRQFEKEGKPPIEAVLQISNTYADLVAIGTIADVMPVIDENRLLIAKGLADMETNCRPGLRALMDAAAGPGKSKQRKITSSYIGFVIAPRINAAGRVAEAGIAVELLLSETHSRAAHYANQLCELNAARQAEETQIAEEAFRMIENMPKEERRRVIVLDHDDWHPGIIGIVASRITERYGLPCILISYDGSEDGSGKGSGRSVKGLNLVEALDACKDLLLRYGGHELAAGLSIRKKDVSQLRRRLNDYAETHTAGDFSLQRDADCTMGIGEMTIRLIEELRLLEPYGNGNPTPNFLLREAKVVKITPMSGGKHVRLHLEKDGLSMVAVWFGRGITDLPFEEGEFADFLFRLDANEFNGTVRVQMFLQDAAYAESEELIFLSERAKYQAICNGERFSEADGILPDRKDLAMIYQFFRKEQETGKTCFPIRRIREQLNRQESPFTYAKIRFSMRILEELQLCSFTEPGEDYFVMEWNPSPVKTDLEQSTLLRKLREMMK